MKPFHFKLQALVPLRRRAEEDALQAYARALWQRSRALEAFHSAQNALAEGQDAWRQDAAFGLPAAEVLQRSGYCQLLGAVSDKRRADLSETRTKAEAALRKVLWARQRREALDRLRDRQKQQHARAVAREEQKIIDERAQRASESLCRGRIIKAL